MVSHDQSMLTTASESVRLRPVRIPDDVDVAVGWYQDADTLRLTEGEGVAPFDAAMVEKMFAMMSTRCEVYIIETGSGDDWQPIGDAALCREAGTPIVIGHPHNRSRGIGRIVLERLVERARELGWPEMVVSGIYTDNLRARRLYERAGFRVTGEIPAEAGRTQWTMRLDLAP